MSGEVGVQTDLADWLLEQIAEDEQLIRRNLGRSGLSDDGTYPDYQTYDGEDIDAASDYLVMFRPPRMLVECDTKRRIINEVIPQIDDMDDRIEGEWGFGGPGTHEESIHLLRLLALPYADRPGYRPEWRPEEA